MEPPRASAVAANPPGYATTPLKPTLDHHLKSFPAHDVERFWEFLLPKIQDFYVRLNQNIFDCLRFSRDSELNRKSGKPNLAPCVSGWLSSSPDEPHLLLQIISFLPQHKKRVGVGRIKVIKASESFKIIKDAAGNFVLIEHYASILGVVKRKIPVREDQVNAYDDIAFVQKGAVKHQEVASKIPGAARPARMYPEYETHKKMTKQEFEQFRYACDLSWVVKHGKIPSNYLKTATRPFSITRALTIAINICNTLSGLHALGKVHRDVRSDNICLSDEGLDNFLNDFDFLCAEGYLSTQHQKMRHHDKLTQKYRLITPFFDVFSMSCVLGHMILGERFLHVNKEWITQSFLNAECTGLLKIEARQACTEFDRQLAQAKDEAALFNILEDIKKNRPGIDVQLLAIKIKAVIAIKDFLLHMNTLDTQICGFYEEGPGRKKYEEVKAKIVELKATAADAAAVLIQIRENVLKDFNEYTTRLSRPPAKTL